MELEHQQKQSRFTKVKLRLKGLPRWFKWTIVIVLLLVIAGVGFTNRESTGIPVQTAKVQNQFIEQSVLANGQLESANKQEFFTPVDSTLMELSVKVGDKVKKGQEMGRLDTQELGRLYKQAVSRLAALEANLVRARATDDNLLLKSAEATYEKAKNKFERVTYLHNEGAVTVEELESAKAEYASAEASYKEAMVKARDGAADKEVASVQAQVDLGVQEVDQAKERLDLATFVAGDDGVVLFVGEEKGNRVLEGKRLLVVGSDKELEVTANVNEIDAGTLEVGQLAKITCTSLPEKEFKGEVTRVAAVAVTNSNGGNNVISVPVTIKLKGDSTGLKPGYTVDINITTMEKRKFLTIPFEAIVNKNGQKFVYVVEKGMAKERKVKTEKGNELYDIVLSGVKDGDEVIVSPPHSIKDGQKVSIGEQNDKGK